MEDTAWGRIVGVLMAPAKTFTSIAARPTFMAPLIVLILLAIGLSAVVTPRIDMRAMIRQSIEDSGRELTPEQMDNAMEQGAKFAKIGPVIGVVSQPIVLLIIAAVFWVMFKLAGGDFDFGTSFAVTSYGMMPGAVAALLSIPVVMSKSTLSYQEVKAGSFLMSSLGSFAPAGTKHGVLSLLSSVDVFSIWSLILMVIGYRIAAKSSRATAIGIVVGAWAVFVLGRAGLAAAFG